jgi:hypothetical protein
VDASTSKLILGSCTCQMKSRGEGDMYRTAATALSREVETPPPSDIDAIVGRPVLAACWPTQFNPATLYHLVSIFRHHSTLEGTNMSETEPDL